MFIVYYIGHVDCYKRAESYGDIYGIYKNKEKAYEIAVRLQIDYFAGNFGLNKKDFNFLNDDSKTYSEKYEYIHDYENEKSLFGESEFTMQPSCVIYHVKEIKDFGENSFNKDISRLDSIDNIEIKDDDDYIELTIMK